MASMVSDPTKLHVRLVNAKDFAGRRTKLEGGVILLSKKIMDAFLCFSFVYLLIYLLEKKKK